MNRDKNGRENFEELDSDVESEHWFERLLKLDLCKDWILLFVWVPL